MPRAPRRCPGDNYRCPNTITTGKYCTEHTIAWQGERTASSRLHSDKRWKPFRARILDRDRHQCQIRHPDICTGHATTVDLIKPAARHPHLAFTPTNARASCRPCNEHKGRTTDKRL